MRTLLPPIKKINKNPVGHSSFSGNACRDKVPRFLKVKFESLSDAEDAFNINYFDECPVMQEFRSTTTSTPIGTLRFEDVLRVERDRKLR